VAEFYERLEQTYPFTAGMITRAFKAIDEAFKNSPSLYDALSRFEEELPNMKLPPGLDRGVVKDFLKALKKDSGVCEAGGLAVEKLYEDDHVSEQAEEVLDAWEKEVNEASDPALKIADIAAKWGISYVASPSASMLEVSYVSARRRRALPRRRRGTMSSTQDLLFNHFFSG